MQNHKAQRLKPQLSMHSHEDKSKTGKRSSISTNESKRTDSGSQSVHLVDNRPEAIAQRKLLVDNRPLRHQLPIQRKENNTGLPYNLKSGIENLSGHSMDDVKVHYNSDKPSQLQAHAYAQGTDIHVASGQEKHLAHEAWHVIQQKQGRVKPTVQLKDQVNINDDESLEKEADVMGDKAVQTKTEA